MWTAMKDDSDDDDGMGDGEMAVTLYTSAELELLVEQP